MQIYLHLMKNISSSHEGMSGLVWFGLVGLRKKLRKVVDLT